MEREFRAHRTEREYAAEEAWRWALAFVIGVAMGVAAFVVDVGIGALNDAKFRRAAAAIRDSNGGFFHPFFVFVGTSAAFGAAAGLVVALGSPLAAGSGIAEIKTYLNGIHIRGLLTVMKEGRRESGGVVWGGRRGGGAWARRARLWLRTATPSNPPINP